MERDLGGGKAVLVRAVVNAASRHRRDNPGGVHLPHATVAAVGNVDVAGRIDRHAGPHVEVRLGGRALAGAAGDGRDSSRLGCRGGRRKWRGEERGDDEADIGLAPEAHSTSIIWRGRGEMEGGSSPSGRYCPL